MMKKNMMAACLFLLVLFLAGCASMSVSTNFDKTARFNEYRTFYLVAPKRQNPKKGAGQNPIFTREMMLEIRPVLESKGLAEAKSPHNADILVHFYAMIRNKQNYVPPTYRVGRWGRRWVARPGHVQRYKEGTLAIDVVDRNRDEVVWQGVGKGVLDRNNPAKNLVDAVDEILKDFPPGE